MIACGERETVPPASTSHEAAAPDVSSLPLTFALSLQPAAPQPDKAATVLIRLQSGDGTIQLEPISGQDVHLLAVRTDLSWLQHLHPAPQANRYESKIVFPEPGEYVLFGMAQVKGSGRQVVRERVFVGRLDDQHPKELRESPRRANVGTYTIEMRAPSKLTVGEWHTLTFRVTQGGAPVLDLQPADALGDLIVLRQGAPDLVYTHSSAGEAAAGVRARVHAPARPLSKAGGDPRPRGPDVTFHTRFPKEGLYKLWLELRRGGEPIATEFVVQVFPPPPVVHVDR